MITFTYFRMEYFLPRTSPNSITGTGLQDLNSTCTGYITYRNDRTDVKVDAAEGKEGNLSGFYYYLVRCVITRMQLLSYIQLPTYLPTYGRERQSEHLVLRNLGRPFPEELPRHIGSESVDGGGDEHEGPLVQLPPSGCYVF